METLTRQTLRTNTDIQKAVLNLIQAEEELGFSFTLDKSSVTLSGGYDYNYPDAQSGAGPLPDEHELSGSLSVSVPVIPQLNLNGSFTPDFTDMSNSRGSISLSASPFASGDNTINEDETYKKAVLALGYLERNIRLNTEQAIFSLFISRNNLDYSKKHLELTEEKYNSVKNQYDLAEATYEDLQNSANSLSSARVKYYNAQKTEMSTLKNLKLLTGPEVEITIDNITLNELLEICSERRESIKPVLESVPESQKLSTLNIELETLKETLKETSIWDPGLSLSANINFPFSTAKGSFTLKFSPDQINSDEREDLEDDIAYKLIDINVEVFSLKLEKEMLEKNIEIAEQSLTSALSTLEQAKIDKDEAAVLYEYGERTEIELEEAGVSFISAENNAYSSVISLIKAIEEFLMLFPENR